MTQLETRDPRQSTPAPPPPAGDPLRYTIGAAAIAIAILFTISRFLAPEDLETPLWIWGRYAAVLLFAWMGHLVGSGRGRVVAENIECLAIAVVMALVLKHFLIEAYKIPTGSMQPTIIGNEESGIFDRVLVNKFAYLVDDPKRFDVIVFKYPLNRSQNYIKRLVGLPGERVMVWNGDIWTATKGENGEYGPFQIARKPRSVRDSVLKTLYPSGRNAESFQNSFQTLAGSARADADGVALAGDTKFRYGGGATILDGYLDGYDPSWGIPDPSRVPRGGSERVGDFALRASIAPETGCREVRISFFANSLEHRAVFTVGGGARIESGRPAGEGDGLNPAPGAQSTIVAETKDVVLSAGASRRVAFFHVDRELVLEVDGDVVLDFPYQLSENLPISDNAIEFEVRGGGARVEKLVVQRDIHYTSGGGSTDRPIFDVPADSLFAMGDNTQNSSDGRMWHVNEVKLPDGRTVVRDISNGLKDPRNFPDIFGETWHLPRNADAFGRDVPGPEYHFVPRRLLLGKALAVFWPIYPHFRWKLIH